MSRRGYKNIALERIERLFEEASSSLEEGDIDRANRYVDLARKIGMRYNLSIPSEFRRRYCKNCYSYLYPSKTCDSRLKDGKLISKCRECGYINRYRYKD